MWNLGWPYHHCFTVEETEAWPGYGLSHSHTLNIWLSQDSNMDLPGSKPGALPTLIIIIIFILILIFLIIAGIICSSHAKNSEHDFSAHNNPIRHGLGSLTNR